MPFKAVRLTRRPIIVGNSDAHPLRSSLTRAITLTSLGLSILLTGPAGQSKTLKAVESSFSTELPWELVRQVSDLNTRAISQAFKLSLHLDKDSDDLIRSITITPKQGFSSTKVVTSLITAFAEGKEGSRKKIRVKAFLSNEEGSILIYLLEPVKPGSNLTLYVPIQTASESENDYTMKIEAFPSGSNHLQPLPGSAIISIQADSK